MKNKNFALLAASAIMLASCSGGAPAQLKKETRYNADGTMVNEKNYEYNKEGKLQTLIDSSYEGAKRTAQKADYIYKSGKESLELLSQLDETSGAWKEYSKTEYAYNEKNLPVTLTSSIKANALWVPSTRFNYEYDDKGNKTVTTLDIYNALKGEFVTYTQMKIDYNEKNQPAKQSLCMDINGDGEFDLASYEKFTYNDEGKTKLVEQFNEKDVRYSYDEYLYENKQETVSSYVVEFEMAVEKIRKVTTFDDKGNKARYDYYSIDQASGVAKLDNYTIYEY